MRTRTALAATVALVAALAAGCGASSDTVDMSTVSPDSGPIGCRPNCVPRATASEAAAAEKAARCMRSHGVPSFPDPNDAPGLLKGHFGYSLDSGLDYKSPQFQAAMSYCESRYIHFPRISPAQQARSKAAAVKAVACMRAHGDRDLPDPDGTGAINLPTGTYYLLPSFQRAKQACASLIDKGVGFVSPPP